MDISKYALFADVADTGNFTKSGKRMGYTQPGVSHILKAMESEFGFPLFVRTKQDVVPTHNAEAILPLVRQLLAVNEQLEQTVSSLNGLTKGHLTIASFASIGRSWLPTVIHTYQQKFPGIEIELLEGGTNDIVHWVENSRAVVYRCNSGAYKYFLNYIPFAFFTHSNCASITALRSPFSSRTRTA